MGILYMNNKGFLLADSLINIIIVSLISFLCLLTYRLINNYEDIYLKYNRHSNERYEQVFRSLKGCEKCQMKKDSSTPEP